MDIDRRRFLGGAGLGLVATLATACGKKSATVSPSTALNAALINDNLLENETSRVAFVIRKGNTPISPKNVEVAVSTSPSGFSGTTDITLYKDTQGGPPYYKFDYAFGRSRTYFAHINSSAGNTTAAINVVPASAIPMPKPGDQMIFFDSPTTTDARGVNPICTRIPPCPMHEETISQALDARKPLVVAFATPKLCQTSTCGPIVDVIMAVKDSFPDFHYLHEEIYTDETGKTAAPAPSAYKLQSEPITYLANSEGKVITRLDGLFGETELKEALAKLS